MKKLELKFGCIKEMLTKEQMKQISGGDQCYALNADGTQGTSVMIYADSCCEAQAMGDAAAWSNSYSDDFPYGIDCACDIQCD